jgi:hypothetical protein
MTTKIIAEDARQLEVRGEYDVLVVGGGPAGIAASIAASRSGAATLLLERYGFLGGMATAGMVGSLCGFFTTGPQKKQIVGGIADNLLHRLDYRRGLSEKRVSKVDPRIGVFQYNPEVFKFIAEEAAMQTRVEILYHTLVVDVVRERKGNRLSGVIVENKSGRYAILSRIIIDATGDGDIACKAGVPYEVGDGKGKAQSLTTIFRMTKIDSDGFRDLDRAALQKKLEEAREKGTYNFHRVAPVIIPGIPEGMVTANMTGIPDLDALDALQLTRAEIEGRRQVFEYLDFFRTTVEGFGQAEIASIAPQVGIRETRRIQGEYILQEEDVLKGRKFNDAIALGAWPVEFHDPETGKIQWIFLEGVDDYYTIPMGCLIPRDTDDLLVAGRCASATHIAQASTRVIAQALAMGEAAGAIAALCVSSDTVPRRIPPEKVREELRRHGAILEV